MTQKPLPATDELLAWFLFSKLDEVPPGELTPPMLFGWLTEFRSADLVSLHEKMREDYSEYREAYRATSTKVLK